MMYLAATVFPAPLSPLRREKDEERIVGNRNAFPHTVEQGPSPHPQGLPDDDALIFPVN